MIAIWIVLAVVGLTLWCIGNGLGQMDRRLRNIERSMGIEEDES